MRERSAARSWARSSGRAGILAILASAFTRQAARADPPERKEARLQKLEEMLQGLGHPVAWRLPEGSTAAGRTLAELNVRARTGAAVLAITRDEASILIPGGREVLRAGDVLAIAGTREAIAAAREALGRGEEAPSPSAPTA